MGIFFLQSFIPGFTERFLLTRNSFLEPWRFVTAIFLHSGPGHLLYNVFALLLFGFILENLVGSKRFLFVFFFSGIAANVFSSFFYDNALGASGAIFGIIGTLTLLRPFMMVWAFSLPMPLFVASLIWVAGDVIGVFIPSGTANLAHLSGLGAGLLIGLFFILNREKRIPVKKEKVEIPEDYVRQWEDGFMKEK